MALGSALMLPAALLAFLRPMRLPYSWAAPPQALGDAEVPAAVLLVGALAVYHGASYAGAKTSRQAEHSWRLLWAAAEGGEGGKRMKGPAPRVRPTELVGPSLNL